MNVDYYFIKIGSDGFCLSLGDGRLADGEGDELWVTKKSCDGGRGCGRNVGITEVGEGGDESHGVGGGERDRGRDVEAHSGGRGERTRDEGVSQHLFGMQEERVAAREAHRGAIGEADDVADGTVNELSEIDNGLGRKIGEKGVELG